MKHTILSAKMTVLMFLLLVSTGCGTSKIDLLATHVPPTVSAMLTATAETQRVALMSYHGQYVTATGGGDDWLLRQEPELDFCGWFTLHHENNGKVSLMTCHDKYFTAPKSGATRADWLIRQEADLGDCGQFVLHDLGSDGIALETCAGKYVTAGDGRWEPGLEWALVGETEDLRDWERFTVLKAYTPPAPVIADFDKCKRASNRGLPIGKVEDPNTGDRITISIVQEAEQGCIAKLDYDMAGWSGLWIQLGDADLSPYSHLVFDIKADPQGDAPEQTIVQLKRADLQEISSEDMPKITTDWQTMVVNLNDFEDSLSSLMDMEELVFVFEANGLRKTGVIYLDNIALQRAQDKP